MHSLHGHFCTRRIVIHQTPVGARALMHPVNVCRVFGGAPAHVTQVTWSYCCTPSLACCYSAKPARKQGLPLVSAAADRVAYLGSLWRRSRAWHVVISSSISLSRSKKTNNTSPGHEPENTCGFAWTYVCVSINRAGWGVGVNRSSMVQRPGRQDDTRHTAGAQQLSLLHNGKCHHVGEALLDVGQESYESLPPALRTTHTSHESCVFPPACSSRSSSSTNRRRGMP